MNLYPPCDVLVTKGARVFSDRRQAGVQLAERLLEELDPLSARLLVLALPRGGVPVGYEVALRLAAPLDVLVVRKLGAPGQPELAIGAIAGDGVMVRNEELIRQLGLDDRAIERVREREARELARRTAAYRAGRPAPPAAGRHVVLTDDGLATGATMRAAVEAVRQLQPAAISVAVPVGAPEAVAELRSLADHVVCLHAPQMLSSIGQWYRDFDQTDDAEVISLLKQAHQAYPA